MVRSTDGEQGVNNFERSEPTIQLAAAVEGVKGSCPVPNVFPRISSIPPPWRLAPDVFFSARNGVRAGLTMSALPSDECDFWGGLPEARSKVFRNRWRRGQSASGTSISAEIRLIFVLLGVQPQQSPQLTHILQSWAGDMLFMNGQQRGLPIVLIHDDTDAHQAGLPHLIHEMKHPFKIRIGSRGPSRTEFTIAQTVDDPQEAHSGLPAQLSVTERQRQGPTAAALLRSGSVAVQASNCATCNRRSAVVAGHRRNGACPAAE